ncbi:MAG: sodium:solute symporter family protein [Verrucomicrobiales bacterium]
MIPTAPIFAAADAAAAETFAPAAKVALGVYLLLLLALGALGYKRSSGGDEDYYLAGRGQGWIVSSLTIMATFFSSFALLSAPGLVYKTGVAFALFALNVPFGAVLVYVLGKRIRQAGVARGYVTPSDMLADGYGGSESVRLLSALCGMAYSIPYVVMQIQAGGLVSEILFPEAENAFQWGAVVLAAITMLYIMVGGMRSVAWTDAIQGSMLMGGMMLAGVAAVAALGGIGPFFEKVDALPAEALTVPGADGAWPAWKMLTICVVASLGSMIQPAQWMRYYAARSAGALKRSALAFGIILPPCFLIGVMLVGLGGRILYPPGVGEGGAILASEALGGTAKDFDKILVVLLKDYLPELLGPAGAALAACVVVAILAASMSTADSSLHALSAIASRDLYQRYLRKAASALELAWVGRGAIAFGTAAAVALVLKGYGNDHFTPIAVIAQMGFLAIGFSTQLALRSSTNSFSAREPPPEPPPGSSPAWSSCSAFRRCSA